MKILIDECLPRKLKRALPNYDVQTVPEAGWSGMKNGELLKVMSDIYDVFINIDNNMSYQHSLQNVNIGFIVLSARNNKLETLTPLMSQVEKVLETIQFGQIIKITGID